MKNITRLVFCFGVSCEDCHLSAWVGRSVSKIASIGIRFLPYWSVYFLALYFLRKEEEEEEEEEEDDDDDEEEGEEGGGGEEEEEDDDDDDEEEEVPFLFGTLWARKGKSS